MRIGHVTTHWLPVAGGQESYLASLVDHLAAAGHDQRVYQFASGARDPRLRSVPRPPRRLLRLREGLHYWAFNALLPLRWPDLAREDLLVVHFPVHWPAVAWHPRVVVVSHGVEWDQPAVRLPHRLRRAIARLAFRRARAVVANDSNFLREMGLAVAPATRLYEEVAPGRHFLPNAVDAGRFRPQAPLAGLADLEPILVPRNVWPGRGVHLAVEAFAALAAAHPRAHLVVAGELWDPAYRDRLLRLVRDLGLTGRVLFAGGVRWEEMPRLYASALLTVIPSLRSEGTSLAALESMASGTPVVATAIGGLADLPVLHAEPDARALARAIAGALGGRAELAARQRGAVLERFTLGPWTAAWDRVIAGAAR